MKKENPISSREGETDTGTRGKPRGPAEKKKQIHRGV